VQDITTYSTRNANPQVPLLFLTLDLTLAACVVRCNLVWSCVAGHHGTTSDDMGHDGTESRTGRYETAALPLSYAGRLNQIRLYLKLVTKNSGFCLAAR